MFPAIAKACFNRDSVDARAATRLGPAKVIAFSERSGQYVLDFNGPSTFADRHHVHVWPDQEWESLRSESIAAQLPALVSKAENLEFDLRGSHPVDPSDNEHRGEASSQGPDFGRLIHDPAVTERELKAMPLITCRRCLGRNRKKGRSR